MTATTDKLEANKKLARDYIDQVFNQHNPGKAADFVTGDVVWRGGEARQALSLSCLTRTVKTCRLRSRPGRTVGAVPA